MTKGADMTATATRQARVTRYAVVCRRTDRGRSVVADGCEAVVVYANDSNDAQLRAHSLRPDLWEERPDLIRTTAVYPVHTMAVAS